MLTEKGKNKDIKNIDELHLIFEGADCTGKTTLVNKIIDRNPCFTKKHFSKPENKFEACIEYMRYFVNNLDGLYYTLADRCFYGEFVYSNVYRGYTTNYVLTFDNIFNQFKNSFLVYTTASKEWVQEHFDGIELNGNEMQNFETIQKFYEYLFRLIDTPIIEINMDEYNKNEAYKYLFDTIEDYILK